VIAHGYVRLTPDIDIALAMDDENIKKAIGVFEAFSYRPRAPVNLKDMADPEKRRVWTEEKHALVLSLVPCGENNLPVNLFLKAPFDFQMESKKAEMIEFVRGLMVPVISLETLIAMKTGTGRERDREDLHHLQRIHQQRATQ
jgi:hypothetical protein